VTAKRRPTKETWRPTHRQKIARQNGARYFRATANTPQPKPDALEKALAGSGLDASSVEGDPLKGVSWRTEEQWQSARLSAAIMRDYEDGILDPGDVGAYTRDGSLATLPDGTRIDIHELIENQRRACHELLKQRVDPKAIAAILLRPESWVKAIQQEFQIF
jgi:hypothetical protein